MSRKNKPKAKRTKPLRRYSPREQQNINDLADTLKELLPATSQGDYCLLKKSKKVGLGKYFNAKLGNKKKQFVYFILQVYGRHPRKFKRFVNDILAEAVDWRRGKGNPVLKQEADLLKDRLFALGINLKKEIDSLSLPTERPKITPPPIHIKQALEKFGLHPLLLDKVLPLFVDGHLNESVRKAGEVYETFIKKCNPTNKKYGRQLISEIFNPKNPIQDVAGYHNSKILDPNDEREGYMFLAMGSIHWCKNVMGHSDVDQLSPSDAAARIILLSHLLEVIDKREE